jgi:signal transduction histidine kinase
VLLNLQNTQKQLVQAEKMASLGVLASGVAHEINNPLNFIKGGAFGIEQYIEENLKEHKEELLPLIEGINIGIDRAANIVTSLNHYNRRSDSNFSQCDIHTIIDNCLSILRNQIAKRIVIDKNYSKNNYLLLGNEGKLHQAMLNILSNAVQAIDGEGSIVIKTIISEKNITISVSDTGCGISDQIMPKIFDPFFTTKEPGKGTGLGLSITFNIIEEHKGTIDFKSKEGEGTTAKIVLPLKKE